MSKGCFALAVAVSLTWANLAHTQDSAVLEACDREAASPADNNRRSGVPGVPPWKIDPKLAVPACEEAAKAAPDDAQIAYQLGRAYSAQKSYASAAAQYAKADERGYVAATYNLAALYERGVGVPADKTRAKSLLDRAASGGFVAAVVRWFEQLAATGDAEATYRLGSLYRTGWPVSADDTKAAELMKKAADAGHTSAMTMFGWLHIQGRGVAKDYGVAREWYEKAVSLGDSNAMTSLGDLHYNGLGVPKDYVAAAAWWKRGAEAGNARAMMLYGWLHWSGIAVARNFDVARTWFEKSAAVGNISAISQLGTMYAYGAGVKIDYSLARMLWEKAAAAGERDAMAGLGWLYSLGLGVSQDYALARGWYERAAERGNAAAMTNLGQFYDYGCGVAQDQAEARRWYGKAREAGNSHAARIARQNLTSLDQPAQYRPRLAAARARGCGAIAPSPVQVPRTENMPPLP